MAVMREIVWMLLVNTTRAPVPAVMDWDEKDPLVLKFTFVFQLEVVWEFAIDLLFDVAEGKTPVAGEGDVRFSAGTTSLAKTVQLHLRSPFGTALLEASHYDIMDFVKAVNEQRATLDEETMVYASIDRMLAKWREEEI